MRKWLFVIPALLFTLVACSPIEDTKNTLDYLNGASNYVNEASNFANEIPTMAEEAVTNPETVEELTSTLEDFQQQITVFNELDAPSLMEDLHNQIEEKNIQIQDAITQYETQIENGVLTLEAIENSELMKSVQDIQSIYQQIQELGE